MIPVLYLETETQYISNGIGRLTDAISCVITQELNGVYELSMQYPHDGIHAADITANRIIYAVPEMGKSPQPFKIRDVDKTLSDQIKIVARHRAYDLSHYACAEFGQTEVVPYQVTPVLYDSSEEPVGPLDDLIQWDVATSGSVWNLTMTYPGTGTYASVITTGYFIYAQPGIGHDLHLFDITTITSVGTGADEILTIQAVADVVPDVEREYNQMTVAQALGYISNRTAAIQTFPFTFATAPDTAGDAWATTLKEFWNEAPKSVRSLMGSDAGHILDVFGGEWEYDDFKCILYENRGKDKGVQYRYGKNVDNISERINIDEMYTHCFSYWKGTRSSSTNTEQGEYFVKRGNIIQALNEQYAEMFPDILMMIIDASAEFEQEPTTAELDSYTRQYIANNRIGIPTVTVNVNVIDLASSEDYEDIKSLETVNLGDTVTIVFPQFGVNTKAEVTKISYDTLRERNVAVTIGETDVALSDIIAGTQHNLVTTKYDLQKWADRCSERAIEALAGWYGGNIRKNFDVNDHKQQSMYIMNTDNAETATRAIKLDQYGLAISKSGVNGSYSYMINLTGGVSFTDAFASDGNTNASFLKRGAIQSGNSYWNMESGEIYLVLVGGSTSGEFYVKGIPVYETLSNLSGDVSGMSGYGAILSNHELRIQALEQRI